MKEYLSYLLVDSNLDLPLTLELKEEFYVVSTDELLDFSDTLPDLTSFETFIGCPKNVLMIRKDLLEKADQNVQKNPNTLSYFSTEIEAYFNSFDQNDLIIALGSEKMQGAILNAAKNVLKEKGVEFSDAEIEYKKIKAKTRSKNNAKRVANPIQPKTDYANYLGKFLFFITFIAIAVFFYAMWSLNYIL